MRTLKGVHQQGHNKSCEELVLNFQHRMTVRLRVNIVAGYLRRNRIELMYVHTHTPHTHIYKVLVYVYFFHIIR